MRSPPNPVTTADGSSARIADASAPAYRSPDGSPHESMTRSRSPTRALTGHLEDARRERNVQLDRPDVALDARLALPSHDGVERNLDAVHAAVVAEPFLDTPVGAVVARAIDQSRVAV